jgi:hypothetical protein
VWLAAERAGQKPPGVERLSADVPAASCASFSADSALLALAAAEGARVLVYDVLRSHLLHTFDHPAASRGACRLGPA